MSPEQLTAIYTPVVPSDRHAVEESGHYTVTFAIVV